MRLETALEMMPGLVIGLTLHECAHALTASWLGDRCAARHGRISLNPFRHLSFWGTLALFILGFGWGNPVPVNLYNFRHPKRDFLLTSLAGPAANLLVCATCIALLHLSFPQWVDRFLYSCLVINGVLALINLIPIPPLDGSRIWPCLIPGMKPVISGRWSIIWLVILVYIFSTHKLDFVVYPVFRTMSSLLPIPDSQQRPANFPVELQVPSYTRARYDMRPEDGADPNYFDMTFFMMESFPPEQIMTFVRGNLQRQGWNPCTPDFVDPNLAIESEWISSFDAKNRQCFDWREGWFHPDRGLVMVLFRHSVSDPNLRNKLFPGIVRMELFTPEFGDYRDLLEIWHSRKTDPPL